jgi:4-hydroxybenzoate polyprenyltransferase
MLRPSQWTKNGVVLAAYFFALWDRHQALPRDAAGKALLAALLFCLVSSGVYVFNDIRDVRADRDHPLKRFRPIAAGRVPLPLAAGASLALLAAGIAGGFLLAPAFGGTLTGYVALQLAYSFWLKQVALVDSLVIAAGFVLRAIGGAVALHLVISPWLLLCTFLLALFLALCKRRHEKLLLDDETAGRHRPSLDRYDARLLDQLIAIVSAATLVSYSIYTLWPDTVAKFGSARLGFSIPFVVFGIFRYLDLVYRHEQGGRPERILLTDIPILVNLLLYAAAIAVVFLLGR